MTRRRAEVEWPSLEPVRSTRIYEEIVRQIRLLITDGHLKSGDRLPPERDLAERFRVSRTSVREAMRALESRGLIGIRPGEGAFVREVSVEALVEPLALVILAQRETIADLYEARRLLEPPIAALAARRASPDEVAEMARILDAQGVEVEAGRTGFVQDAAFHTALAHSTHNRAITRIVTTLMDLLAQSREESLSHPGRPVRSHGDHRHVLAAVEAHDARRAEQAMRAHLVGVERLVVGREDEAPPRVTRNPSS
ncbi:MAG TPA: FadR/GntR family transcriptional regulator [Methylomirabilota bacterium]|nr:FadR/GntR family transcriptional regulator [Methylomirabilota bacterium]